MQAGQISFYNFFITGQGRGSLVESTVMFQPVTHSVNAAQPVSQQGGAQQVEPAQAAAGSPGTIRKANHDICHSEQEQHFADFVQMGDAGVDVGEHVELA